MQSGVILRENSVISGSSNDFFRSLDSISSLKAKESAFVTLENLLQVLDPCVRFVVILVSALAFIFEFITVTSLVCSLQFHFRADFS